MNCWMKNCIKRGRGPAAAGFDAQELVKSIDDYFLSVQDREIDDDVHTTNT